MWKNISQSLHGFHVPVTDCHLERATSLDKLFIFYVTVCHYIAIFTAVSLISEIVLYWSGSLLALSDLPMSAFVFVTRQRKDMKSPLQKTPQLPNSIAFIKQFLSVTMGFCFTSQFSKIAIHTILSLMYIWQYRNIISTYYCGNLEESIAH